jgi:cobalt-zinc-cadmium efflux system outer membrane protein
MHRMTTLAGMLLLGALPLSGQQPFALTLDEALERARQSAPAVVAARMRIEEARGRVAGASLRFATNPTLDVEAGRRSGETSTTDYGIEAGQEIELPGRRRARLDAARAGVSQEEQRAREVEREAMKEVATTFLQGLAARERVEAAASGKHLAEEALRIAESRYAAGDVAQLDVNLARTAVARGDAEARAAAATLAGRAAQLQLLLGMSEPVQPEGTLGNAPSFVADGIVAGAGERSDLRLLDSEIAEAEAEVRYARTLRTPDLGLRASYAKEEGDRIVLGGVGVTLPLFQRGQEATSVANARLARLRFERESLARTIEAEVRGALATYDALREAAVAFEATVLPLIEENERLALESYEVGQIGLADLLVVRREALDARRTLIDQLIDMRLAEVELRAGAGVWK